MYVFYFFFFWCYVSGDLLVLLYPCMHKLYCVLYNSAVVLLHAEFRNK